MSGRESQKIERKRINENRKCKQFAYVRWQELLAGESYDQLADTYVIFICDFDPFGNRLYRYTIENRIQETGKALNDGSQTIILSTKGKNQSEVPVELVRFLQYVAQETDEAETEDDYVKNRDWEGKYMLLEEMMREERMEGMQEGIQKGQERINQLKYTP